MTLDESQKKVDSFPQPFTAAVKKHNELYRSRTERAGADRITFMTTLICSPILGAWAEQDHISHSFTSDARGLKIDVGPEGDRGIHTHFPYHLLTREVISAIRQRDMSSDTTLADELTMQAYRANPRAEILAEEYAACIERAESHMCTLAAPQPENLTGTPRDTLCAYILSDPQRVVRALHAGAHLTPELLSYFIHGSNAPSSTESVSSGKTRLLALMRLAEELSVFHSGERERTFKSPGLSYEITLTPKHVYERRKRYVRSPIMAEVAKCVSAILAYGEHETLSALGLQSTTGTYGDGNQFIALWSTVEAPETERGDTRFQYARVLVHPEDTFPAPVRDRIAKLPTLQRSEFEVFDAQMAVFNSAQDITGALIDPQTGTLKELLAIDTFTYLGNELLKVLVDELEPDTYKALEMAWRESERYVNKAGSITPTSTACTRFTETLTKTMTTYRATLADRSSRQLTTERLAMPHVRHIAFGDAFLKSYPPEHLSGRGYLPYDKEMILSPVETQFVESPTCEALPFAHGARMLRALGIPHRHLIACLMGAARNNENGKHGDVSARIADAIYNAAQKKKANVGKPGTQSGYGNILLKPFLNAKLAGSTDCIPEYFSIIPGKQTWYPGNPFFDYTDTQHTFAATPNKAIVTPYGGGWGTHKRDIIHHNDLQEKMYQAASDGFCRSTVIANGGHGAVTETIGALSNDSALVLVTDAGRFSTLVPAFLENKHAWTSLSDEELESAFPSLIQSFCDQDEVASLLKDITIPHYTRDLVYCLRQMIKKEHLVHWCSSHDLERTLVSLFNTFEQHHQ